MLGNPKAGDILKELKFLKENKIRMHVQIVLCPGYNDDKQLQRTIRDLYGFYPYVSSIAVVPVGLTMHRKQTMRPVEKEDAIKALEIIASFQKRFKKKHGVPVVYGADELYLKGGVSFPALSEYAELPQIENGVGLAPLFISQAKKMSQQSPQATRRGELSSASGGVSPKQQKKKFLTFTGMSFYPYLKKITDRLLEKEGISITVIPVENTFFGKSITVTGLLTGRDIIKALSDKIDGCDCLFVPDVVMREGEAMLLDDITKEDIERALGIKVKVIDSTPEGLIKGMEAVC